MNPDYSRCFKLIIQQLNKTYSTNHEYSGFATTEQFGFKKVIWAFPCVALRVGLFRFIRLRTDAASIPNANTLLRFTTFGFDFYNMNNSSEIW